MKNVYFLSDAHLGSRAIEHGRTQERRLVNFLDSIKHKASAVYLLGDMFDFWYEFRLVVPKGYTRFLGKISELTDMGVEVHFFTGNHDIWCGDYLTKECGVTIHREDCSVLAKLRLYSPERMVTAVWGQACDTLFPVDVAIHGRDLQPLLRQISDVLAKERVNITTMKTHSHGLSVHVLCTLEIQRAAQLERLLRLLRELPCVISANRA